MDSTRLCWCVRTLTNMLSLDVGVLLCREIDFSAKMITNTQACGPGERGGHNSLLTILPQKHFIPTHKNVCNSMRVINRRKFTVSEKKWSRNSSCTHSTTYTKFNVSKGHFEDSHEIFCTPLLFIVRVHVPTEMEPSVVTNRMSVGWISRAVVSLLHQPIACDKPADRKWPNIWARLVTDPVYTTGLRDAR